MECMKETVTSAVSRQEYNKKIDVLPEAQEIIVIYNKLNFYNKILIIMEGFL